MAVDSREPSVYPQPVAVILMLVMYAALARFVWRILVDSFPGASAVLAVVFGIVGVAAAVGVIAFGASGAARAGWMQAERILHDDEVVELEANGNDAISANDVLDQVALLVGDWHSLSPEERQNAIEILQLATSDEEYEDTVTETLDQVTSLIDDWHSLSPEERHEAVELLTLAAGDADDALEEYEDTVNETLQQVTSLINDWHSLSPEERHQAVELLTLAAGEYDDVPF